MSPNPDPAELRWSLLLLLQESRLWFRPSRCCPRPTKSTLHRTPLHHECRLRLLLLRPTRQLVVYHHLRHHGTRIQIQRTALIPHPQTPHRRSQYHSLHAQYLDHGVYLQLPPHGIPNSMVSPRMVFPSIPRLIHRLDRNVLCIRLYQGKRISNTRQTLVWKFQSRGLDRQCPGFDLVFLVRTRL